MVKYKRRLETVDAFQWTGGPDQTEDPEWIVEAIENGSAWFLTKENHNFMVVLTPYGQGLAEPGDYVFKDEDGINIASKEEFEKRFTPEIEPLLSQTIIEYIDACTKRAQEDIIEQIRKLYED